MLNVLILASSKLWKHNSKKCDSLGYSFFCLRVDVVKKAQSQIFESKGGRRAVERSERKVEPVLLWREAPAQIDRVLFHQFTRYCGSYSIISNAVCPLREACGGRRFSGVDEFGN